MLRVRVGRSIACGRTHRVPHHLGARAAFSPDRPGLLRAADSRARSGAQLIHWRCLLGPNPGPSGFGWLTNRAVPGAAATRMLVLSRPESTGGDAVVDPGASAGRPRLGRVPSRPLVGSTVELSCRSQSLLAWLSARCLPWSRGLSLVETLRAVPGLEPGARPFSGSATSPRGGVLSVVVSSPWPRGGEQRPGRGD